MGPALLGPRVDLWPPEELGDQAAPDDRPVAAASRPPSGQSQALAGDCDHHDAGDTGLLHASLPASPLKAAAAGPAHLTLSPRAS